MAKAKEQTGTLPGVYFEPPAESSPLEAERQRSIARLFARAPGSAAGGVAAAAKGAARTIFAAMDIIIVKADARMRLGEVWFGELRESLVATKGPGGLKLSGERLAVRYFKPDTTGASAGTLRYAYELDDHVTWSAIYGTVGHTTRRRYDGVPPKLVGFDLSQEEFESARELVSGASGPPPVAVEFEEFREEDDDGGLDDDGGGGASTSLLPQQLAASKKRPSAVSGRAKRQKT